MPCTIIEAMMMGKPVVATDILGLREEVLPGETGVLVPTHSPDRRAAAIARFVDDFGMGMRLREAGGRALILYDEKK